MATTTERNETEISTPSDTEVLLTRTFDAPLQLVFDAYTKPEHVQQWMLGPEGWTMPSCEIDLRPGGRWHHVWRRADGTEYSMGGEYREISPPTRIVYTESWGPEWPETVDTIDFTEQDGRTTIAITIRYESQKARDAAMATGMKDGVDVSYNRLDVYLAQLDKSAVN